MTDALSSGPVTLVLNAPPLTIPSGGEAVVSQAKDLTVLTISSQNEDVVVSVLTDGLPVDGSPFTIPGTMKLPFPLVKDSWGDKSINITNRSTVQTANASVGCFGVNTPPNPTFPLTMDYQDVQQYQSIGGVAFRRETAYIQLYTESNEVAALLFYGWGACNKLYVLNCPDNLPPIFDTIPDGVLEKSQSNLITIIENFWGNYLLLVNISKTESATVKIRMVGEY